MRKLSWRKKSQPSLRLHKSASTLPLAQWIFFCEGKDLRWFCILPQHVTEENLPALKEWQSKQLQQAYNNILFSLPNHDLALLSAYAKWRSLAVKLKKIKFENEINKDEGLPQIQIEYYSTYRALYDYLAIIRRGHTLQIKEFSLDVPKIELFLKDVYGIKVPDILTNVFPKVGTFYSLEEYISIINNEKLSFHYAELLLSQEFCRKFLTSSIITIEDPVEFARENRHRFVELRKATEFLEVSLNLFHTKNLKSTGESVNIWEQITVVKTQTHNFDNWNTTLAEYLSKVNIIEKQAKAKRALKSN